MAVVIPFPVKIHQRVCTDCENHLQGPSGVYCRLFNVDIVDELEAERCEDFDPLPWAPSSAKETGT